MSASYWMSGEDGYEDGYVGNCTYNLGPMLRAANPAWDWYRLVGSPVSEATGHLSKTLSALKADPDRFRELNPPNGWGDYDGLVEWLTRFVQVCENNPYAFIEGSV